MNQSFNIKRFCQYARFIMAKNRWYYGILFVGFTIPAVVLSFCEVVPEVASVMIGFVFMTLNHLPSIEWTRKISQRVQWNDVLASRTEKLVYECIVRFSGIIIPIVICSIGFAFGLGSPDKFFSDVVPMGGVSLLLALAMIFFLLWDIAAQKQDNRERTNMYSAISQGFVLGIQIWLFKSLGSSIIFQIICFAIAAILFVFAVIKYPNPQVKINEH